MKRKKKQKITFEVRNFTNKDKPNCHQTSDTITSYRLYKNLTT